MRTSNKVFRLRELFDLVQGAKKCLRNRRGSENPATVADDRAIRGVGRIDGVITGETNHHYRDFVRAMGEVGSPGYISYELCHQLPVINGETVGIEFAHKNAQLAAEFMREIIRTEYEKPATQPVREELGPIAR